AAADAYVQDGTSASTNFGTATTLQTKKDTTNNNRESFLKFDLTSVTNQPVVRAYVRMVPTSVGYAPDTRDSGIAAMFNQISFVADDSWTETGITYNNKPASDPFFGQFLSYVNEPLDFDVTSLVRAGLSGDKKISLRLNSIVQSSAGQISFASREYTTDTTLRPQLVIQSYNGLT